MSTGHRRGRGSHRRPRRRYEGQLYVTGRLKDLVIVDGRNHYPQDVEETVPGPTRRPPGIVALFAIEAPTPGRSRRGRAPRHHELTGQSEADWPRRPAAVAAAHGLALHDVVLVPPGHMPRTSSGKIARSACRERYLATVRKGVAR